MATTGMKTTRDWLGAQNEVQFFIHSSLAEPLSLIGVGDTSQYTIQVCAKVSYTGRIYVILIPLIYWFAR